MAEFVFLLLLIGLVSSFISEWKALSCLCVLVWSDSFMLNFT